jgi:predicted nucleic-acid-binding protein
MKLLVDANIVLDVLLERPLFFTLGTQVLGLSCGGVELFVSASSITDIYYIIRKEKQSKEIARMLLENLLSKVSVASISDKEIRQALNLNWADFEDAVQYAVGESLAVDYIVTRNIADFASAAFPVVSPEQLLNIVVGEKGKLYDSF